jgi:N-acetylmuramoyl-L-alanine amidase
MEIIKDFISERYYKMVPQYITIHETSNYNNGANAKMHAKYLKNIDTDSKCWHFTVDDKEIYQHIPTDYNGWHCTDGLYGDGNRKSIGIEICVNRDGDFDKALQNAAELIASLMKKYELNLSSVVQHAKWYKKECPARIRKEGLWDQFKEDIYKELTKDDIPEWKLDALKELYEAGIINDYEGWKKKINQPLPAWASFIIMNKIRKEK